MKNDEIKIKLGSIAESIRANIVYDMQFEIDGFEFFKLKIKNDCKDRIKLTNAIYKYNTNGY